MPSPEPSSPLQVGIACAISFGVAIIATISRLYIRSKRRFGADDILAAFSMLASIIQMVALLTRPKEQNAYGVIRYYLVTGAFYSVVWLARLSILFSVIRIVRDTFHPRLRTLSCVAALFFLLWASLMAQLFWECEMKHTWKRIIPPRCNVSVAVPIFHLIADVVSDSILLIIPVQIFTDIRETRLRFCLIALFGSGIITTGASLVHTILVIQQDTRHIALSIIIESAVALTICNVPILVSAIFRLRRNDLPSSPNDIPSLLIGMSGVSTDPTDVENRSRLRYQGI